MMTPNGVIIFSFFLGVDHQSVTDALQHACSLSESYTGSVYCVLELRLLGVLYILSVSCTEAV